MFDHKAETLPKAIGMDAEDFTKECEDLEKSVFAVFQAKETHSALKEVLTQWMAKPAALLAILLVFYERVVGSFLPEDLIFFTNYPTQMWSILYDTNFKSSEIAEKYCMLPRDFLTLRLIAVVSIFCKYLPKGVKNESL